MQPVVDIINATNTSTLDPLIKFSVGAPATTPFAFGVDDSDSDKFKIEAASSLAEPARLS